MAAKFYIKNSLGSTWSSVSNFFVKTTTSGWAQITDAWVKTSTSTWSRFYSAKYAPDTTVNLLQSTAADGYTVRLQGNQKHWTPTPVSLKYYFSYIDSNGGTYYIGSGGSSGAAASNASVGSYITYPSSSTYITIDTKGSNYSIGGTATYYFEVRGFDNSGTAYPAVSQEVVQISTPTAPNVTVTSYDTNSITISVNSTSYNNWYLTNRYVVYTSDSVGGLIQSGGGRGGYSIESSYGSTKSITLTGLTKGRTYGIYVAPFTGSAGATTATATGYAGIEGYVSQTTVNGYFVTYSANGGINPPTDSTSYNYGDLVNTKAQGSMTYGSKAFTGWNTSADGTGTPYTAGSSAFYIYAPVTLYAQWLDIVYPPNQVGSLNFSSNTGAITWTFTPSSVDSSHSAPTGYAYTYNTTGTTPSNGSGTFIDTATWASTSYSFAIQLLTAGSTYYGFIQPRNVYNGTTQYAAWTSVRSMTKPPVPTYTYYYGNQNSQGGGINVYGHSTATSLSYTVYRTGTGTATSGNSYVGYGTGSYTFYDSGTYTKTEGTTYFGTYYPATNGYYYIIAYQTNLGGDGSTSTSQTSPQNWYWGPPSKPDSGTVSITTNTGNYSVGSIITYSTSGWTNSPYSTGYVLELHNGTNPVLTSDPLRASTTSASGTYTITSSDVPNYFKAWATASNAGGTSTQAFSSQVGPAYTPVVPGAPTINSSSSTTSSITLNFTKGTNSTSTRAYLNGSFDGSTTITGTSTLTNTAVTGATSYTVNYWLASSASGANAFNAGTVNVGNVTSYQISYANNPTTGVYCNYADGRVLASNAAGSSNYSTYYPSATTYV